MKKKIPYQNSSILVSLSGRARKKVLVLLHGFCEDSQIWDQVADLLPDVRLVRIDLPGFGGSTPLPDTSISQYAEAVKHVITALGLPKVSLLGHSLGGYVALAFAELYPSMLNGFGLVNSHPWPDTPERKDARNKSIRLVETGKQKAYVSQLFPSLFPPEYADIHQPTVRHLINRAAKFPASGITGALTAMRDRNDTMHVLQNSNLPVLLLLGAKDGLISPEMVDQMIPAPSLGMVKLLPDVGHMAMIENPSATAQIITDFLHLCHK